MEWAVARYEQRVSGMTARRGFGRGSAEWFLARGLGRGRRRAAAWSDHQNVAVDYLPAGRRQPARAAAGGRA